MSLTTTSDSELLVQFRNPVTKERAYTSIIKKYQEKLYWHIRRMVVQHKPNSQSTDDLPDDFELTSQTPFVFLEHFDVIIYKTNYTQPYCSNNHQHDIDIIQTGK